MKKLTKQQKENSKMATPPAEIKIVENDEF